VILLLILTFKTKMFAMCNLSN